ncbi:MAG: 8-amino-7-oxononanoate synthase [Pseudomonadota bacterium]
MSRGNKDKLARFRSLIEEMSGSGLLRQEAVLSSPAGGSTIMIDGAALINLSSNDYLGLALHPDVVEAACRAARSWGSGSRASRLICGTTRLHARLEEKLCEALHVETCVVFGSGYLANTGLLSALASRGDIIYSDSLNHASIVDGCRLSKADVRIYGHADAAHLEELMDRDGGADRDRLVVTETTFSMEGDEAPLGRISAAAAGRHALFVVDEAHSIGVKGERGKGLSSLLPEGARPDIIMGTFGKAIGSYGAFVTGPREVRDMLTNRCRTLIYSTSLPPAVTGAAARGIEIAFSDEGEALRAELWKNCGLMKQALEHAGWGEAAREGPVFPLKVGSALKALDIERSLRDKGVFLKAIRYPSVPKGTERLRIVVNALLTRDQIQQAGEALKKVRPALEPHALGVPGSRTPSACPVAARPRRAR